jgi:hypothetical protein
MHGSWWIFVEVTTTVTSMASLTPIHHPGASSLVRQITGKLGNIEAKTRASK